MADQRDGAGTNPAEVRGNIQKGRTGDKIEGFDPAASPLETDSEAGGQPLSPEQVEMANARAERGLRETPGVEQASHGTAMREFGERGSGRPGTGIWIWVAVGVVVLIIAIWLAVG